MLGNRIHVIGNSCSGKSTVGGRLGKALNLPLIELDALNWEPGWVGLNSANPQEFERRILEATQGDGWVVAGSYKNFSQRLFWPRLHSVVWLDLPLPLLVWRALKRSWHRWRSKELLWGTNYERFWPQLMVWNKKESLVAWIVTQHHRKRQEMFTDMVDPRWGHIRFVHLQSLAQIRSFSESIERNHFFTSLSSPSSRP